ncbi:zinc ABC transporter ATP-binding protein ZnuC [Gallibacterium trehalosifermentans]|uniref:Zinc ABC transporter ATP-binding protein ZnuC n=1 Tax=Gallibacterium trehalosifermentans TaxID=516935 RepID=A0ABV6H078_9PAST
MIIMQHLPTPLVELKNISVQFNEQIALQDISLAIQPRSITTIVGPNGGGKSTLLKVLLKLITPQSGSVNYAPNTKIGYVPQKIHIDPSFPITVIKFLSLKPKTSKQDIDAALKLLSISHLAQHSMQKLSGGEMQRVLLARAILNKPNLLVLDEPTQGVDVVGQNELYELINQMRERFDCAVLMVSHDLHLVMAKTDHVFCINQHLCCEGTPNSISIHPNFIDFFNNQREQNVAIYTHHHDHKHNLHGDVCCSAEHRSPDCQHQS